jgi:hypothetical protein
LFKLGLLEVPNPQNGDYLIDILVLGLYVVGPGISKLSVTDSYSFLYPVPIL